MLILVVLGTDGWVSKPRVVQFPVPECRVLGLFASTIQRAEARVERERTRPAAVAEVQPWTRDASGAAGSAIDNKAALPPRGRRR